MDLTEFAEEVGPAGPVTIAGLATRGGPVDGVPTVMAPGGVEHIQPDEMTVRCGAGTPVEELDAALAVHGQSVALPPTGTVGGALAVGRSGLRRLGYGPVRDAVLQLRYVDAGGRVVLAGGPTVKNVSGFDLCRLLVGSHGTLGFLGDVILRTRPRSAHEQWFSTPTDDPTAVFRALYRPTSVLWDGETAWALLEGHRPDVEDQARHAGLAPADPPERPTAHRWSIPPSAVADLDRSDGRFLAEVGVGVVHHERPQPPRAVDPAVRELHRRIKARFDPTGRLNPGVDPLTAP